MRVRVASLAAALSAAALLSPVAVAQAAPAPAASVVRTAATPDPAWRSIASAYLNTVVSGTADLRKKAGAKAFVKDVSGTTALMNAYAKQDKAYLAKQSASFSTTVSLKKRTTAEAKALATALLAKLKSSGAAKKFASKRVSKLSLVVYTSFDAKGKPVSLTLWMSAR